MHLAPRRALPPVAAPLAVAGLALAATLALRLRDPHVGGSWGFCPLRSATGLDCPFCGGLRATNDLTHGNLGAAAASNLVWVATIPLLVVLWVVWTARSARPGSQMWSPSPGVMRVASAAYVGVWVVFTIVRNTTWGHGLWA